MTDLQATIEFQVELGKFYNVDLFQRGYIVMSIPITFLKKLSPAVFIKSAYP